MALVKIKTANTSLTIGQPTTYLTSDTAAGVSALTVKNITGFAINQILVIGQLGNENTEIIKTHASTAPTGSTITLAAATVFPHSASTYITAILYDQVEISTATTVSGSKTVLTTTNIVADSETTNYNDTANSTGYYFARFKNTITSTFSSYSDPIPTTGYTLKSARRLIDQALGKINKQTSPTFSDDFAFGEINNCQTECLRDRKRWSFMQVFDYDLGQLSTGQWRIALPDDIDDENTNKSIYNFRVGTGTNLTWVDKAKWNEIIQGVAHTTLATNVTVGALTVTVDDAGNFNPTQGTLSIGANNYTYTSLVGNVFTLNTASTTTNTSGEDVFQGATIGMPQYWTTFGGYLYFYPIIDPFQDLNAGILDYYSKQVPISDDTTEIVLPDPTVVINYLCYAFLMRQNNGVENEATISWYAKYKDRKDTMYTKEVLNRNFWLKPRLNKFDMSGDDPKSVRIGNFLQ